MKTPVNRFKKAISNKQAQIGLWVGLASSYSAEICAMAGFDWLLVDGEHAPNNLQMIQQQLQTIAAYPVNNAIARVPVGDAVIIKQYLDLGFQSLLVPMVDTAAQAEQLVRAMRYPQDDGKGGIPPSSTLIFDVELLEIKAGAPAMPAAAPGATAPSPPHGAKRTTSSIGTTSVSATSRTSCHTLRTFMADVGAGGQPSPDSLTRSAISW